MISIVHLLMPFFYPLLLSFMEILTVYNKDVEITVVEINEILFSLFQNTQNHFQKHQQLFLGKRTLD